MMKKWKEFFSKNKKNTRYGLHMLLLLIIAAGVAFFSNAVILENAWNKRYLLFTGILLMVIVLCSYIERNRIYTSLRNIGILTASFLVSGLLLLLSDYYVNLPVWMIGGIIAAALVSRNVGMLYLYFFVFHAVYLQENCLNGLMFHFIMATIIAFLIPKMKTFLSMFYMMVLTACLVLIGSVLHNKMVLESGMLLDTFYILCTYLGCIFVTMLLVKWCEEKNLEENESTTVENDNSYSDLAVAESTRKNMEDNQGVRISVELANVESQKIVMEESTEAEPKETILENPDYTPYCDEKSELLLELKAKNRPAYAQAVLVGKLASETANAIGINAELTKAGGLYRNIRIIREENNNCSSAEIAKENAFPQPLIYLLEQLNDNNIRQKEAALLLITDEVTSYYSIVRHVQKNDIPVEKIVDTIVAKKIFRGELNETEFSMQECFLLREKLITLLKRQDSRQTTN